MDRIQRTALVVDDDAEIRDLVAAVLEFEGCAVIQGCNGEEALSLAIANLPDLIVLDVMMPVKDGFETLKELRQDARTAHIPVVMITAINEVELGTHRTAESTGLRLGVIAPEAFLDKPVQPQALRKILSEVLGF